MTLPGIDLLGVVSISGETTDLSGSTEILEEGTPDNHFGGISALSYTGTGSRYIALADRGPADGAASYRTRYHVMDIEVIPGDPPTVEAKLMETVLLTNENGENLVGLSSKFDSTNSPNGLRFDPEGVSLGRNGEVFISDEYGPFIYEFDSQGRRVRCLKVPASFCVRRPAASKKAELASNSIGRATNKGFEGLAISPEGDKLYAVPQAPLLQDRGQGQRNCRMLELDLSSGTTRQYAVPLDSPTLCFNELLSVGAGRFLTIERDEHPGEFARRKKIVLLDATGATDVSTLLALPADLPRHVLPVRKAPFLDLLEARFHLAGDSFPEKVEGLALGPVLPDGRRIFIVATDNDFVASAPTLFWVFAVPDPQNSSLFQKRISLGVRNPDPAGFLPCQTPCKNVHVYFAGNH